MEEIDKTDHAHADASGVFIHKLPIQEVFMLNIFALRPLPAGLEGLADLALDLRWTGSDGTDRIWRLLDPEAWELTSNPYMILQNVSEARLQEAAEDERLLEELRIWLERREQQLAAPGWFGRSYGDVDLKGVAYFSMEFGLSEALPIYSGGLGILAGDYLKTAGDLGVPVVGLGLLYQQGYFHQILTADGWQLDAFPYNDPTILPVVPVQDPEGGWLRIKIPLPGRILLLRVWQARVGRIPLYLLDSNDPLNNPWDRGITATLYAVGQERRLIQEIVLGIGGWRVLEELGVEVDVCHLNEGHAAFAVIARAVSFMHASGQSFQAALWATRAGNIFTTHTPVAAGFDRYEPSLMRKYAQFLSETVGEPLEDLLARGRQEPGDAEEPFNMAYLAIRCSCFVNGVSRLHGEVSRENFQPLFPDWPREEVPVRHVTNGVHVPSWSSPPAHALWNRHCGEDYWLGATEELCRPLAEAEDVMLWEFRAATRHALVDYVRRRLMRQVQEHGESQAAMQRARHVLDPNAVTLGFARRFTAYKRPNLLLSDPERLARILLDPERPAQLIVAGKAHPNDEEGKGMVQAMALFAARPELFNRVVFLEDYDLALAQQMTAGIDVWINTPRRTWEACGTSGMKVLVNGGLNLSELDGWWAEAYTPEVGWALGDGREHREPEWDGIEAGELYDILERHVVPAFYDRDEEGVPRGWIARVRASMVSLTPRFSSNRMLRDYIEMAYIPAARAYRRRSADGGRLGAELLAWHEKLTENWQGLRFRVSSVSGVDDRWRFEARVYLGDLEPEIVRVELYAEPPAGEEPRPVAMERKGAIPGAVNGYFYAAEVPADKPAEHYSPRIVPYHADACVPLEDGHIFWQR